MTSKRRHEGYFLIDHRNSPGIPDDVLHSLNLPKGSGRGVFEAPTITCSHCHAVVVLNPSRTRPREWCAKCNHYVCDTCSRVMSLTGECRPMERIIEETQDAAAKAC